MSDYISDKIDTNRIIYSLIEASAVCLDTIRTVDFGILK